MIEHEPYALGPKVNVRPRFDFDSDRPLDGEEHKADHSAAWAFTIDWTATAVIILAGWRACEWWYYGGWGLMRKAFMYWLPWLLPMAETGYWN